MQALILIKAVDDATAMWGCRIFIDDNEEGFNSLRNSVF